MTSSEGAAGCGDARPARQASRADGGKPWSVSSSGSSQMVREPARARGQQAGLPDVGGARSPAVVVQRVQQVHQLVNGQFVVPRVGGQDVQPDGALLYEGYSDNVDGPGDLINNRHGAVIGQQFREGKLRGDLARYVEEYVRSGRANTATNCASCPE